jgi:hypothetical protein
MVANILPTEFNRRLADLLRTRIIADKSYIAARVAFWRLVGFGILVFGMGASVGACFYGYSHINDNSDTLTVFSSTLSSALSQLQLMASAEGIVEVEPHEISLAKGQTISIDSNSRLHLDPAAQIQVRGEVQVHTPPISIPQSTRSRAPPKVPMITNFTVFKRVPFENGYVMTGWVFLTSAQKAPTSQYCYYTKSPDDSGLDVVLDIAEDQKVETPKGIRKEFDMLAAFNRCVWFKSEPL